jgi:two-component system, sporulation sensor kinase C
MPRNLQSDAETFRAVADYTYDWESWHAPDGQVLWTNPAVERTTGHSIAECLAMKGYPLPMIVSEDRGRIAKELESARNGTSGENIVFRCLHTSGETRWMSMSWQPIRNPIGESLGFRTSVRDITEIQKLRDQLKLYTDHLEQLVQERTLKLRDLEQRQLQMEKLAALGQLAAGVAHEINNPLAGIRNAFELIKSSLPAENEHYELLELIDREFDRISNIIHQMYQLYRRGPHEPTSFPLERAVGEVVALLESVARQEGVAIAYEPEEARFPVKLPEGEVKQILYNVIRNAIQASPPTGTVEIDIEPESDEVLVTVTDQGAGIPKEIQQRIFEPFFSTKQGQPQAGMGLGLSVTRSLLDAMGGRIDIETESGRGTSFVLTFPVRSQPSEQESDDA